MKKVVITMKDQLIGDYAIADYDDYLLEAHKAAFALSAFFGKRVSDTHYRIMDNAGTNHIVFRYKSNKMDSFYPSSIGYDHIIDMDEVMLNCEPDNKWNDFEDIDPAAYEQAIIDFYNMEDIYNERIQHPKTHTACPF